MSIKIFVGTHTQENIAGLPNLPELQPVLFQELNMPDLSDLNKLAENRFFLSQEATNVETDFVGFVSARVLKRNPEIGSFEQLVQIGSNLKSDEIWCPTISQVNNRNELLYWINLQESVHPGIARILLDVDKEMYEQAPSLGNLFLGNQFIISRHNWLEFIYQWRKSFYYVLDEYGQDPEISFRCVRCGSLRPEGYFRYGPNRRIAFIGERLTSLHFAHNSLRPVGEENFQTIENFSLGKLRAWDFYGLLPKMAKYFDLSLKLRLRFSCSVCSSFDPNDGRSYTITRAK